MTNLYLKSAITVVAVIFSATSVLAHAELVAAKPAADATVATSPPELDLTFSESIDLKFSGAKLEDSKGSNIPLSPASLAKDNDKTLVIPLTKPLPGGNYVVTWHNLSRDGHKMKGTLKFTVKP